MTSADKRHGEATGESLGDLVAIHVWDWPVRLFHWSIVALVVIAVVTSYIGGDAKEWHMRAGYGVLAMVLFRILWGFAGTRHARFASFVRGPRTAIRYARSFARRAPQATVGHNPLGGWSVIALLLALLVQAGTGLFANDDVLMEGPLVKFISDALSDRITTLHHLNVWAIGILVGMHIAAVIVALDRRQGEPRPSDADRQEAPAPVAGAGGPRQGAARSRHCAAGSVRLHGVVDRHPPLTVGDRVQRVHVAPMAAVNQRKRAGPTGPALFTRRRQSRLTCCGSCRGSCRSSWSRRRTRP